MPAWRRRRFMKLRARARKLGLKIGSIEWRTFLGLKDKVVKPVFHFSDVIVEAKQTLVKLVRPASKPIAEPVVKIPKTTKEDRRPRPAGKR